MTVDVAMLYYYRESFGPTVLEHIRCFEDHSRFNIIPINTADPDTPNTFRKLDPAAILMHYTLFGMQYYQFPDELQYLVGESRAIKATFFQDEYYHCPKRFRFINECKVDAVYTLFEPQCFADTYYAHTDAAVVRHTLAGYVSDALIDMAESFDKLGLPRAIDVGYRGHELDISFGLGGREKTKIADKFKARAKGTGMTLDVETSVDKRIYGNDWYRFIASCKGMLGVEAGVSAVDMDDAIRLGVRDLRRANPGISDQDLYDQAVARYDNNIPYRMISPRHFEAAALGTCQMLYEGKYSGVLIPNEHYIPLKRDMSNFDEAVEMLRDDATRLRITENARRDLIDSGRYSYAEFVLEVERDLKLLGLELPTRRSANG